MSLFDVLLSPVNVKAAQYIMIPLNPAVKTYHWGSPSNTSIAAKFIKSKKPALVAECWFGSHPSGPALMSDGNDFTIPMKHFPYLAKVISVSKPLSIQIHPNKQHAVRLHEDYPERYPDRSEKPEIIIALTPFTALCGTLPTDEIKQNLLRFKNPLRGKAHRKMRLLKELMRLSPEDVAQVISDIERIPNVEDDKMLSLILSLNKAHPNDPGVLAPVFMSVIELTPYSALIIPPRTVHAYLHGEGVEVMAPSDNVIRAGLTGKEKDLKQFFALATLSTVQPIVIRNSFMYIHPCFSDYFVVRKLENTGSVDAVPGETLVFVTKGLGIVNGRFTKVGDSFVVTDDTVRVFGLMNVIVVISTSSRG